MTSTTPRKYRIKHNQTILVDDLYRITLRMPGDEGSKGRRCELEIERLHPPIRIDNLGTSASVAHEVRLNGNSTAVRGRPNPVSTRTYQKLTAGSNAIDGVCISSSSRQGETITE